MKNIFVVILIFFSCNQKSRYEFERLHYWIYINAEPEDVYKSIVSPEIFSEWKSVFNSTSHFVGTWEEGSTMYFLTEDNNNISGLISKVTKNTKNIFVDIEHYGLIDKCEEILNGKKIESLKRARAKEEYAIFREDKKALLIVYFDTFIEEKKYFKENWPIALRKLKSICEKTN